MGRELRSIKCTWGECKVISKHGFLLTKRTVRNHHPRSLDIGETVLYLRVECNWNKWGIIRREASKSNLSPCWNLHSILEGSSKHVHKHDQFWLIRCSNRAPQDWFFSWPLGGRWLWTHMESAIMKGQGEAGTIQTSECKCRWDWHGPQWNMTFYPYVSYTTLYPCPIKNINIHDWNSKDKQVS